MKHEQVTKILIGILAAIHLYRTFLDPDQFLINLGCFHGHSVFEKGEYWRLVTGAFLHGDWLHLAFNSWCLWQLLPYMTQIHGPVATHVVLWLSVVGGALASGYMNPIQPGVGISGGVFGLFSLYFLTLKFFQRFNKSSHLQGAISQLIFIVAINLVLGFTIPRIDNAGHIGGMITGLAIGSLVIRSRGL